MIARSNTVTPNSNHSNQSMINSSTIRCPTRGIDSSTGSVTTTKVSSSYSSSKKVLDKARRTLSKSLQKDLPMLMYGSGDVHPSLQNNNSHNHGNRNDNEEETVHNDMNTISLLSELTCDFMHDFVNAAIDSHDIYADGKAGDGGGILPPMNNRKRVHRDWEEQLTAPIIKSEQRQGHQHHQQLEQHTLLSGLDFQSNAIRSQYLSSTTTINEKSFLLPIYHDNEMYNRSKEILSFHNDTLNVLFDSGVRQFLNDMTEEKDDEDDDDEAHKKDSSNQQSKRQRKESISGTGGSSGVDGMDVALNWPGHNNILPTYSNSIRK